MRTTIKTGSSYRVPSCNIREFRVEGLQGDLSIFGNHVDRLGKYEDSGLEPEDLKLLSVEVINNLKARARKKHA